MCNRSNHLPRWVWKSSLCALKRPDVDVLVRTWPTADRLLTHGSARPAFKEILLLGETSQDSSVDPRVRNNRRNTSPELKITSSEKIQKPFSQKSAGIACPM